MKRGFTLAELLGVLIILAVIAMIAFPIINKSLKDGKERLYNSQLEEIKLAAEKWAYKNINLLPTIDGEVVTITLLNLKESGDLPLDVRDPRTNELMPNDMMISIEFKNNNYIFTVDRESGSDITNEFNENAPIIILNGSHIEFVEINSTYKELSAKAEDKNGNVLTDINITYQENGHEVASVDTSKFTTYTVIYSATSNGYTSQITRTVIIRDTTAPNLTIPDNVELTLEELASFNLLTGVSVTDNSGEEITVETRGFDRLPTDKIVEYKACDSRDNCITKRRLIKIVKETEYLDNSGANKPELLDNMIPIKYDGTNWVYADISEEWYDYDNKEWANAVVLNSGVSKSVGQTISESEIALWYVWIPRYKYQLFNANNGSVSQQLINVTFESGTASTGTVSCTDAVRGSGSSSQTCTNASNGNWYTHPAFTFGSEQVSGFWVGKFEVSGSTSKITVKPGVQSLRSTTVSNFFTAIQNIRSSYSLSGDSHMMKNMEWGAVAYLKQSKYGLGTTDITINSNSSYYTGGGSSTTSYKSNTGQSTTGNVYGVYDMSGGAWEYVMGNMVNSSGSFYSSSAGFSSAPNAKYYDKYTYDSSYTSRGRGKLGDATKETLKTFGNDSGGWYSDYAYFVYSGDSWFYRGGRYSNGSNAGVFDFSSNNGSADSDRSARAVLIP